MHVSVSKSRYRLAQSTFPPEVNAMKRFLLPLIVFIALIVFLGVGLRRDPREVPSPLVGKPAPNFSLTQLQAPEKTISPKDMEGKVWLLNVWASWCVACREEHPVL